MARVQTIQATGRGGTTVDHGEDVAMMGEWEADESETRCGRAQRLLATFAVAAVVVGAGAGAADGRLSDVAYWLCPPAWELVRLAAWWFHG
jgi:hypothetical protein